VQSGSGRIGSRVSCNFWVGRVRSVMLLVGLDRIKKTGDMSNPGRLSAPRRRLPMIGCSKTLATSETGVQQLCSAVVDTGGQSLRACRGLAQGRPARVDRSRTRVSTAYTDQREFPCRFLPYTHFCASEDFYFALYIIIIIIMKCIVSIIVAI